MVKRDQMGWEVGIHFSFNFTVQQDTIEVDAVRRKEEAETTVSIYQKDTILQGGSKILLTGF